MGSVKSNKIISLPSPSSASRRIEYPFWFGGAASCIACTVSHPLDLTKVRLQTTHGVNKASTIYTMIQIIKTEGILGLYSGLSASILRQITYSTMRFGVYDKLKNLISKNQEQLPFTKKILCASIAGSIGGAFGNPADLVMVRMQNDAKLPLENRRNYKHALDGLYRIVKEDGFRGLTRGIGPNVNRAILMNSSQLATYDQTKQMLLSTKIFKDNIITHFVSSVMASIMQVLSTIIRAEGPLALFKGWVPAFVRLGPHTVVTFMVLEQIKNLYDKRLAFKSEKASATLS
ncbi:7588_t:CDS:2 [Rhizophagus irregularis]|nr:7588_t:CDS:2 [Rhizophagus irregularis]